MPKKVKTKLTQIPMTIPGLSAASEEATSLSRYDDFINAGKNCSEKSEQEATPSSDEKSIESEQSLWGNFVQFAEESRSSKKKNDSQVWIDDDLKIILEKIRIAGVRLPIKHLMNGMMRAFLAANKKDVEKFIQQKIKF